MSDASFTVFILDSLVKKKKKNKEEKKKKEKRKYNLPKESFLQSFPKE